MLYNKVQRQEGRRSRYSLISPRSPPTPHSLIPTPHLPHE